MLLDRDDWYDIAHDLDWSLSYVAHEEAFPAAWTGSKERARVRQKLDPSINDSMFTTKEGGMLMGLPISRSIIAAHGGRIWASPGDSVGAVFQVALPSKRGVEVDQIRD